MCKFYRHGSHTLSKVTRYTCAMDLVIKPVTFILIITLYVQALSIALSIRSFLLCKAISNYIYMSSMTTLLLLFLSFHNEEKNPGKKSLLDKKCAHRKSASITWVHMTIFLLLFFRISQWRKEYRDKKSASITQVLWPSFFFCFLHFRMKKEDRDKKSASITGVPCNDLEELLLWLGQVALLRL